MSPAFAAGCGPAVNSGGFCRAGGGYGRYLRSAHPPAHKPPARDSDVSVALPLQIFAGAQLQPGGVEAMASAAMGGRRCSPTAKMATQNISFVLPALFVLASFSGLAMALGGTLF